MQAMQVDSVFAEHFRFWLVAITSFIFLSSLSQLWAVEERQLYGQQSSLRCVCVIWASTIDKTRLALMDMRRF